MAHRRGLAWTLSCIDSTGKVRVWRNLFFLPVSTGKLILKELHYTHPSVYTEGPTSRSSSQTKRRIKSLGNTRTIKSVKSARIVGRKRSQQGMEIIIWCSRILAKVAMKNANRVSSSVIRSAVVPPISLMCCSEGIFLMYPVNTLWCRRLERTWKSYRKDGCAFMHEVEWKKWCWKIEESERGYASLYSYCPGVGSWMAMYVFAYPIQCLRPSPVFLLLRSIDHGYV